MSCATIAITLSILVTFLYFLYTLFFRREQKKVDQKLPPGPPTLPIIGNLHILGKLPHRTLQSLSLKYGPIMSFRLGKIPTIVVSSPAAAELFLKTHDTVFADRPQFQAADYFSYGSKGLVFSDYGPYWRSMRKLCTLQLLNTSKRNLFVPLRRENLGLVVKSLEKFAAAGQVVDLSKVIQKLSEDIVYKMIFGNNSNKDETFNGKELVEEGMSLIGAFNLADYLPWLGPFDLQGLTRRLKKSRKAIDELLERIITEREQALNVDKECGKSFIDILLPFMGQPMDFHDEQELIVDQTQIKAIMLEIFGAAFDTSSIVVDWALSELLRHPRVMKNLQDEIKNVVGMRRMVQETDLYKFSYLDSVVKETLRLHPAGPLIPRESREDIMIDGYYIEKRSRVLVNLWAIGRDPKTWSDNAEAFYPERFMNKSIDLRGQHFQLIPFGAGRRGCPGMHLGLTIVKLFIAQLVHCFDWELPFGISPAELDMTEKYLFTMPKAKHLLAIPTCRMPSEVYNGQCELII